jgi:hypothetical protein
MNARRSRNSEPNPPTLSRTGLMAGQITVPDDFDWMVEDDIADQFVTKA